MELNSRFGWFFCLLICSFGLAQAHDQNFKLVLNIQEIDNRKFATQASFRLPLNACQAWRYLTDYESAASIPGVLSAKATRLDANKAQLNLDMEERILFLTVHMKSVLEFWEITPQGTDFVQVSGDAKLFQGTWRIEPNGQETVFRYNSIFQPDSTLPMVVIQYFFDRRLRHNFAAIAQIGATYRHSRCP